MQFFDNRVDCRTTKKLLPSLRGWKMIAAIGLIVILTRLASGVHLSHLAG